MTSDSTYKVSVGINYFDDVEGLIKILTNDSVYDYVDKFYVIDGIYSGRKDLQQSDTGYLNDLNSI